MPQFLQHIEIESVEEVGVDDVKLPHYQQYVNVVNVVDQNGDPWVPEPPAGDLEIAENGGANWSNDNDYEIGQTVTAMTATYTGGVDPITYRYRWQTKDLSTDAWTNGDWIATTNAKNAVTYSITGGGQFRLNSQAKDSADPSVAVNSMTGTKTVAFPTLTVSTPVASGDPIVGELLTCAVPTVSGALEPYTISYMWTNAETHSIVFEQKYLQRTLALTEEDDGISYYCQVTVASADSQTKNVASNTLGPVLTPLLGTLTASVDGNPYDHVAAPSLTTNNSASHILAVTLGGNSIRATYAWEVRMGAARLTPSGNTCVAVMDSDPPQGVQIQCNIRDDNASDSPQNYRTMFYVSD